MEETWLVRQPQILKWVTMGKICCMTSSCHPSPSQIWVISESAIHKCSLSIRDKRTPSWSSVEAEELDQAPLKTLKAVSSPCRIRWIPLQSLWVSINDWQHPLIGVATLSISHLPPDRWSGFPCSKSMNPRRNSNNSCLRQARAWRE